MSAEAIARVVRDLRDGRFAIPDAELDKTVRREALPTVASRAPVIDATAIYHQLTSGPGVDLYEAFEIHPVWPIHVVGYQNGWGNVMLVVGLIDASEVAFADGKGRWESQNEIAWADVKHILSGWVFFGGLGGGHPVRTTGPISQLDVAVYEGGKVADIHWTQIMHGPEVKHDLWENQMLIWLQTITLAGCTNVELVEPDRPRSQRRRLERTGVTPQEIVIRRISRTTRGERRPPSGEEVPQSFVRGHFARYGPEYGRELLFGKYAGRFWIPAHARGSIERQQRDIDYKVDISFLGG